MAQWSQRPPWLSPMGQKARQKHKNSIKEPAVTRGGTLTIVTDQQSTTTWYVIPEQCYFIYNTSQFLSTFSLWNNKLVNNCQCKNGICENGRFFLDFTWNNNLQNLYFCISISSFNFLFHQNNDKIRQRKTSYRSKLIYLLQVTSEQSSVLAWPWLITTCSLPWPPRQEVTVALLTSSLNLKTRKFQSCNRSFQNMFIFCHQST